MPDNSYTFTGTVTTIGETVSRGAAGFTVRQIVLDSGGKYPQPIPFEFVKDRCALLDGFKPGDVVTIGFNLRGNEYKGNIYLKAQGWRISKAQQSGEDHGQDSQPPPRPARNQAPANQAAPSAQPAGAPPPPDDDVPF